MLISSTVSVGSCLPSSSSSPSTAEERLLNEAHLDALLRYAIFLDDGCGSMDHPIRYAISMMDLSAACTVGQPP